MSVYDSSFKVPKYTSNESSVQGAIVDPYMHAFQVECNSMYTVAAVVMSA